MSDDGDAIIIALPSASERIRDENEDARDQDSLGATRKPWRSDACDHRRHASQVDNQERRVYCGGCGVELDTFDTLSYLASRSDEIIATRRRLRREIVHLAERVETLKKDERNTKSRLRHARQRLREIA